jgi:succinate dehydrogenase/fumarate reductase flavoprotein subunit
VEREHRALVVGSGHAGTKHADALRELGIPFTGPVTARRVMEESRALEDPLESASREQWVNVA